MKSTQILSAILVTVGLVVGLVLSGGGSTAVDMNASGSACGGGEITDGGDARADLL